MTSSDVPSRGLARHEVPEPLRNDVRLLGGLLGRVLRESGGEGLFEDVERLRELAIRAHDEPDSDALDQAEKLVAGLDLSRAEQVARAFTCYFHLANLAEEYHRVRVLREREASLPPQQTAPDDSLPAAYEQLAAEVGQDEARAALQRLEFRPVLTAHPTEARRRAVARSIRRIAALVAERDALHPGGMTLAENERRLLAEIDALWRTSPLRASKPTVLDEVATVLDVFDATLADTLPAVYRRLDDFLLGDRAGTTAPVVHAWARLGTWIGGDRDGNPNVTAEVTRAAAALASEHALTALEASARAAADALTLDAGNAPPSSALVALWQRQRALADTVTARMAAEAVAPWLVVDADRDAPPTFDELRHWRGLAFQRAWLPAAATERVLAVGEVRDRVQVWLDGRPVGVLARDHHDRTLVLPAGGGELLLLVEDQGRVGYGPRLGEVKGVLGPVTVGGVLVRGWQSLVVEHDALAAAVAAQGAADGAGTDDDGDLAGPVLAHAAFALDEPADLFLDTTGWGKGMAWVNGWPLGRYWSRGPQHTLYVPAPATRAGRNDLVVLELGIAAPVARFVARPDLGHTEA